MMPPMDDATAKAVDKIAKLMQLAAKNPNEAEAASALAKAQELLAAYNLDIAVVEQHSGKTSGKRLDEQVRGGVHKYQRALWRYIAELNFCYYWTQKNRYKPEHAAAGISKRSWLHEHRLVGRQVNVVSTKHMGAYLEGAIERLCRERLGGGPDVHKQYYSRWAVAYREGVADRVIEKVRARREDMLAEEEAKIAEAARRAAAAGESASRGLTLASLTEREEMANFDFLHGEGAWARRAARQAEWEKDWAARRERQAQADKAAEAEQAAWAAAHPEEAAKQEAQRLAKERAAERRANRSYGRRRFRGATPEEIRRDSGAYAAGYEAGEGVSIEEQVANDKRRIGN